MPEALASVPSPDVLRRARRLQWLTIGWVTLEAVVAVAAGLAAGSVSLQGFGVDSVIELVSGAAALWRVRAERREDKAKIERLSLRIVAVCFLLLAIYLVFDSSVALWHHQRSEQSPAGIAITAASVVVMPVLASQKRKAAQQMGSRSVLADAAQTDFCGYLSAIALGGLLFNWLFGWWWSDPVAALIMVPIIANEASEAFANKSCSC